MSLDLAVVFFTFLDFGCLLLDLKGHLIGLKFVLCDSLVELAALYSHTIISLRLLHLNMFNPSFTSLNSQFILGEGSENI